MPTRTCRVFCSVLAIAVVLYVGVATFAEPPANANNDSDVKVASDPLEKLDKTKRVSVEAARERAKLSHSIYSATLDTMHHRYFRDDRSSVPARAMQDVFAEIAREENIKANWISVNTNPMSVDHKPNNDFEKQAAKEIGAGKNEYEEVENGVYRRAQAISLMNRGCLGCHLGFGASGKKERFAGLVITIPVTQD